METLSRVVGCGANKFPFIYLGLPVGENMSRIKSWDRLIAKFKKKMAPWKVQALSIGGRATLIKSILGGLGIYYLSLFVMPVSVAKKLEAM